MKKDVPPQILSKIMDAGYEDLIVDIFMKEKENDEYEISDIPISPKIMKNSNEQVIISQKVFDTYLKLVQRISNPEYYKQIAEQKTQDRKQIFQTIIMYNGDFITISSDGIAKSNNVKVQNRDNITIPTATEIRKQMARDEQEIERE